MQLYLTHKLGQEVIQYCIGIWDQTTIGRGFNIPWIQVQYTMDKNLSGDQYTI